MKILTLKVDGKSVGSVRVQDVCGCSGYDPFHLAAGGFVIDLTLDQAQQLADMVTHQVSRALVRA
jgi:hypothetical protein